MKTKSLEDSVPTSLLYSCCMGFKQLPSWFLVTLTIVGIVLLVCLVSSTFTSSCPCR